MNIVEPGKGLYGRLPEGHEILMEIATGLIPEYAGVRWQNRMAEHVRETGAKVIVETGVQSGVSSDRILRVLEETGGMLYSCDPHPLYQTFDTYGKHPNWRTEKRFSLDALPIFFMEAGEFDIFIHDSDHEVETQTFEYEAAWGLVKPGGWILSDDWTWAQHNAWTKFCGRHALYSFERGSCVYAQKPLTEPEVPHTAEYLESVMAAAYELSQMATDKPAYFR